MCYQDTHVKIYYTRHSIDNVPAICHKKSLNFSKDEKDDRQKKLNKPIEIAEVFVVFVTVLFDSILGRHVLKFLVHKKVITRPVSEEACTRRQILAA